MTTQGRRKLIQQLANGKAVERRSATRAMWKSGDRTYAPFLLESLKNESLSDASVWQSKCLMIAALGDFQYRPALSFLKKMTALDFHSSPIIYSELAFAICRLKAIRSGKMEFVHDALKSKKPLFASGAFHAIYFLDFLLDEKEIIPLIRFARRYSKIHPEDEQLTCMPRDYLAAAAYQWKGKAVNVFLVECQSSEYPHLREIANASLQGVRSKDSRLGWYK